MAQVYSWRISGLNKVSADVAGALCAQLAEQGKLDAKTLVDVSRDENAPLHGEFEWDDTIASEKYREYQAKGIMSNIVIKNATTQRTERAFVSVTYNNAPYEPLRVAMSDPYKQTCLLDRAKTELVSFKIKYSTLTELAEVIAAIDKVIEAAD